MMPLQRSTWSNDVGCIRAGNRMSLRSSPSITTADEPNDVKAFLYFRRRIYRDDPHWIEPLWNREQRRLDPDHNPFYRVASRRLFMAKRGNEIVGTVAAIDPVRVQPSASTTGVEHVGYFGHFETIDDRVVVDTMLRHVATWLGQRGVTVLRGPYNGSPYEGTGALVEGHDLRPALWHGHTPPYYADLLEAAGLEPCEQHVAYYGSYDQLGRDLANLPPVVARAADRARVRSGATVRRLDPTNWDDEIAMAHRIYVVSHATIPGHGGMSLDSFRWAAEALRPILDPELAFVVEVRGAPVGLALTLPDINEALHRTRGRTSGLNLLKLIWYRRRMRSASFKLLGVLPGYRRRGIEALLILTTLETLVAKGYEVCEASLVSSDNHAMSSIVTKLGARPLRRYQVYQRRL